MLSQSYVCIIPSWFAMATPENRDGDGVVWIFPLHGCCSFCSMCSFPRYQSSFWKHRDVTTKSVMLFYFPFVVSPIFISLYERQLHSEETLQFWEDPRKRESVGILALFYSQVLYIVLFTWFPFLIVQRFDFCGHIKLYKLWYKNHGLQYQHK